MPSFVPHLIRYIYYPNNSILYPPSTPPLHHSHQSHSTGIVLHTMSSHINRPSRSGPPQPNGVGPCPKTLKSILRRKLCYQLASSSTSSVDSTSSCRSVKFNEAVDEHQADEWDRSSCAVACPTSRSVSLPIHCVLSPPLSEDNLEAHRFTPSHPHPSIHRSISPRVLVPFLFCLFVQRYLGAQEDTARAAPKWVWCHSRRS